MREYIKVSVSLGVVCLIATFLLAFVNSFTAPKIKEATDKKAIELCKTVYEAESFEEQEISEDLTETVDKIYRANDGGYVIAAVGKGYGGDLVVMVGVKEGKVVGSAVLTSSETQNIGTKVESEEYASRYLEKTKENFASVDAIAGATRSSNAYKEAVGNALSAYDILNKEVAK